MQFEDVANYKIEITKNQADLIDFKIHMMISFSTVCDINGIFYIKFEHNS